MAVYRTDPDLFFLAQCDNIDLDILVSLLTHDPQDASLRWSETLSGSEEYKRYHPDHQKYWPSIAAEIQTFGANTLASMLRRGKGVTYREVLCDACDKMKVSYGKNATTEDIELSMLLKVLETSISEMSQEQLKEFATGMEIELTSPTPELVLMSIQTAIRASGFAAYRMAAVVVSTMTKALLGRGLQFGAYVLLSRAISVLAGPVGWALSSLWLATDIAGPAYRVTIPACLLVAYMRQKSLHQK